MFQYRYNHTCRAGLIGLGVAGLTITHLFVTPAWAQIIPDATLGNEPSVVSSDRTVRGLPATLIEGGALRGKNLFQSFQEFNVANGQRVYFANPAGVESILSRVTGANPSRIFGLLGVDGAANLFLMNPNGILFGSNARLDIAGSFVATTADRLTFDNGSTFSAKNPEAPPLLTVTLRPNLPYGTNYQGDITHSGNLVVGAGQTLSLQGRSVSSSGTLTAPGGTVQVLGDHISLLDQARIDVSQVGGGGTVLIGGDFQGKGLVPNASQTTIAETATINADAIDTGDGGRVIVWANDSTRFSGQIRARGGEISGDGGFVEVSGKQTLNFDGWVDTTALQGKPGQLLLDPFDLEINQPFVSASEVTFQADNNITFNAPVTITGLGEGLFAQAGNSIFVNSNLTTNGGTISLESKNGDITVRNAVVDTCPSRDCGTSAFITLDARKQIEVTDSLLVSRSSNPQGFEDGELRAIGIVSREGSVLLNRAGISTTNNGTGDAGLVVVTAFDTVEIRDSDSGDRLTLPGLFSRGNEGGVIIGGSSLLPTFPTPQTIRISNSRINVDNDTEGNGVVTSGTISIQALGAIEIGNGSRISSSTFREGNAGEVLISTGGRFSLSGDSRIFSNVEAGGQGIAGDVRVEANSVTLDNSLITTGNFGTGRAGIVVIRAGGDVNLVRESGLYSRVGEAAEGNAGGIGIKAANLFMDGFSEISTTSFGQGDAGLILVDAEKLISIRNESGIYSRVGSGLNQSAGAIILNARSIHVRRNSRINVDNLGTGVAGDILISARGIWLDNRSGIIALSRSGNGGNILLDTDALILGRNSFVAATAGLFGAGGDGGNIAIGRGDWQFTFVTRQDGTQVGAPVFDSRTLLIAGKTFRDNNILSEAFSGTGGNIRINAFRLQNIADRPDLLTRNDISTQSFVGNSGTTVVNTLNIFPSFRVDPLPERNDTPTIAQGCDPRIRQESSQFVISGRGGLPPNAADGLTQTTLVETRVAPDPTNQKPDLSTTPTPNSSASLNTPARGWIRNSDGTIRLVAQATDPSAAIAPTPSRYTAPCYAP